MPHLAVLTSGGDAPGMNAALRAVVRTALAHGYRVSGVRDGYTGLLRGDLRPLGPRDVGGIMQKGGTVLGTTRCESLKTPGGLQKALEVLRERAVDALIVIGGNGSQSGAAKLAQAGAPVIGIASTIDNDLYGSDVSVGATTAVEVALESGRTHQIRVHLKAIHHPVVCDPLYAPKQKCDLGFNRLGLHAYELDLPMMGPEGSEVQSPRMILISTPPADLAKAIAKFPDSQKFLA